MSQIPTLNQGQEDASDAFLAFLMSPDPFFVISGPAGTGKTFLMNHLSNAGLQLYYNSCNLLGLKASFHEVHFTATTNKAAEVLERSIGKPVSTIHSFLGLKVRENYKTGKTEISKTSAWKERRNMVVFIDECSMIDSNLFAILLETFKSSKIVFVGDHAQMAPVGEPISPIYTTVDTANFVTLTEPVRNAGQPALVDLCNQLRDTVETGIFKPIKEVPGVIDYLDDDQMPAELTQNFAPLDPPDRVLCYTNARVQQYNEFVRDDVRGLPSEVCVGDVFVVASAYASGKSTLSVERELRAKRVGSLQYDHSWSDVLGQEPIPYRLCDFEYNGGLSLIENVRVAENRELVDFAVKAYAKQKNWSNYFDLKAAYLDIRDKAACTVYKSQGSTYGTTFIDIGNIGTSYDAQQVARMLYVAVSRAQHRVCFYGRLPGRYHDSQGAPLWIPEPGQVGSPTSSSRTTSAA